MVHGLLVAVATLVVEYRLQGARASVVTAGTLADTDIVGYGETEAKGCFAILHFSGGNLLDKDYEVFSKPDDKEEAVSSLLKQYYLSKSSGCNQLLLAEIFNSSQSVPKTGG